MNQRVDGALAIGRAVRLSRTRMRLKQEDLARRIGVGRMTVSRLERGEDVSVVTAMDALGACGLALTASSVRGWMTAAEHAAAIGEELVRGDHDFALRLLRQALDDLSYLADRAETEALSQYLAESPVTGDRRWDLFLSLSIGLACDDRGIDRPAWPYDGGLDEPFFPARPGRRFVERTVERTRPEYRAVNIWVDDRDLSHA